MNESSKSGIELAFQSRTFYEAGFGLRFLPGRQTGEDLSDDEEGDISEIYDLVTDRLDRILGKDIATTLSNYDDDSRSPGSELLEYFLKDGTNFRVFQDVDNLSMKVGGMSLSKERIGNVLESLLSSLHNSSLSSDLYTKAPYTSLFVLLSEQKKAPARE